jgi:tungstate transport system permease protein
MEIFTSAFTSGWALLRSGAIDIWGIVLTSLRVSGAAVFFALIIGLPTGFLIGSKRFVGRSVAIAVFNAGMGLPPVFVGLIVSMSLSRRGPFGELGLLYTRTAMVISQVLISTPVVVAITAAAVSAVPRDLLLQAQSLGAGAWRRGWLTLSESRIGLLAAVAGGFGAIISEVGAVQMVGGNLEGDTRVMTTAIVQFTRMGLYGEALALAIVLFSIVVAVNVLLVTMQRTSDRWEREL